MIEYIAQTKENGFSCCHLIALLNAHRFWGLKTVSPSDPEWEDWVDVWKCRHGAVIGVDRLYADLQICWKPLELENCTNVVLPISVSHFDRLAGFHSSLVIAIEKDMWTIVNKSGWRGDLIQQVPKTSLDIYKGTTIKPPGLVQLIYTGEKQNV